MMTTPRVLIAGLFLIGPMVAVPSPDGDHPAPAPRLGALRPLLGTFHALMVRRAPGETGYRPMGEVTIVRDTGRLGTAAVLRNVAEYAWVGGRRTLDSTISLAGTLAPISERTGTPSLIIEYDLSGRHATGRMGPVDSLRSIDDSFPAPAFNSTDLDMLVTALHLARHFRAAVPLYDPEFPGYRIATLRVTGAAEVRTAAGSRRVWRLAASVAAHPSLHYLVGVADRRVWQKTFTIADGTSFRVRDAAVVGP